MYVAINMASAPKNTHKLELKFSIIIATYMYYTGQYNLKEANVIYNRNRN